MRKLSLFLVSLSALCCVSCGGGGAGVGTSLIGCDNCATVTISISPGSATVGGGMTAQFSATVSGATNTKVTWQVNGMAGGNASVGIISTAGLYTAPLSIPPRGAVTITAVSQADASKSASANVNIVFSSAMLSGQYAFRWTGYDYIDSEGALEIFFGAGSFAADGSGTITDGIMDLNNFTGVYPNLTLTGTYTVGADGRAEIILTDSDGFSYTIRAVLISADRAHMIQFDTLSSGKGLIERQDPNAFNNGAFAGGYAFRFTGVDDVSLVTLAGRLTADGGGAISAGIFDLNDGASPRQETFTGSYSVSPNGRGEAVLNTTMGTISFAFYIISPSQANFISLDFVPAFLGPAEKQSPGSFSNASLAGDYAFASSGFSSSGFVLTAGRFAANGGGGIASGLLDENDEGSLAEGVAFTGSYAMGADGRGTASFNSALGTSNYAVYLISPSRAFFVQLDSVALATGEADTQQGGPFSTTSLAGNFGFSLTGSLSDALGQFRTMEPDSATGTLDINTWTPPVYTQSPDQTFTADYAIGADGRGDFTATSLNPPLGFHIYVVSPSKAFLIGVDENLLGTAERQF